MHSVANEDNLEARRRVSVFAHIVEQPNSPSHPPRSTFPPHLAQSLASVNRFQTS